LLNPYPWNTDKKIVMGFSHSKVGKRVVGTKQNDANIYTFSCYVLEAGTSQLANKLWFVWEMELFQYQKLPKYVLFTNIF